MSLMPTGCGVLDEILGGGLPVGALTLIYGEAATGKTTLAMQTSLECARRGFKVVYVDADQSFSHQRFVQMSGFDDLQSSQRIAIFFPESFSEQTQLIEGLGSLVTQSHKLIVLDSVTNLYRAARGREEVFALNRELNRQLAYLADLALSHHLAVIVTGQVHARPGAEEFRLEPVAKRALFHWPKLILNIKPTARSSVKEVIIERNGQGKDLPPCIVTITDKGFEAA